MPGKPNASRSASTVGVIRPRSSAMIGTSPSVPRAASKRSAPGPGTQRPLSAVASPAGTSQYASKPRKWSRRTMSTCAERRLAARDPPAIAVGRQRGPSVERVAPELAGGAEVVGRHAGDDGRRAALVELEQLRVGPDVGAVVGDEDRDVADDADLARVGICAHPRPLARRTATGRTAGCAPTRPGDAGPRRARPARGGATPGPGGPRRAAVRLLERHEQGEVVEPGAACSARNCSNSARWPGAAAMMKRSAARCSSAHFAGMTAPKSTRSGEKAGAPARSAALSRPSAASAARRDQQRVAGEGGEALVGRVAVAGRAERQDLPEPLLGRSQEVDEAIRLVAQVADAESARQRRWMEQKPTRPRQPHAPSPHALAYRRRRRRR